MSNSDVLIGVWTTPDNNEILICYNTSGALPNDGFWSEDPLKEHLPILYRQMALMTVLAGTISYILRPLNQPFIVSSIIAGILLGPSVREMNSTTLMNFFPFTSIATLETFTSLGLVYYMFLCGLEMNFLPILGINKKSMIISIAGVVIPLAIGFYAYGLIREPEKEGQDKDIEKMNAFVCGIILAATNFPDLTRILAKLKLLRTEIGRTALASAFLSDISTWFFIVIVIAIPSGKEIIWLLIRSSLFVVVCMYVMRPALSWILHKLEEREEYCEIHVLFVLFGVLICGFIADAIGSGSYFGAFMFGFILPSGQLATMVKERIEKIMSWMIIPMFCLINGLRTNIPFMVPEGKQFYHIILFFFVSWAAKFLSTILVSIPYKLEPEEAVSLGVLMNTRGLLAIVILNISRDLKFMDVKSFSAMVLNILLMTFSIPPIIKVVYKPRKGLLSHKWRNIESTRQDTQLKLLVCVHSTKHVHGMIKLLQISYSAGRQYVTRVSAVHLVELTPNTSAALLIMHGAYKTKLIGPSRANTKAESDQIVEAFKNFKDECNNAVYVESLAALSPYNTMHVDICSIAEEKCASLIILPFHIEKTREDEPEEADSSIRDVNQKALEYPPCSVGILVSRGFGRFQEKIRSFVTFFIGGRDDREALSYAIKMVSRPEVHLTVVRINQGENAVDVTSMNSYPDEEEVGILKILEEHEKQKELDDKFIHEFRIKTMSNMSVHYSEEVANSGDETLRIIRDVMVRNSFELCILGRSYQRISPLVCGISDLTEFPELGSLGDAIFTSGFASNTSLLVVQQYVGITARSASLTTRLLGSVHR